MMARGGSGGNCGPGGGCMRCRWDCLLTEAGVRLLRLGGVLSGRELVMERQVGVVKENEGAEGWARAVKVLSTIVRLASWLQRQGAGVCPGDCLLLLARLVIPRQQTRREVYSSLRGESRELFEYNCFRGDRIV